MTGYKLIKYAGDKLTNGNGGNVIVDSFEHYSTAMAALRKTDSGHFVQGPRRAFWFDESKPQTQAMPESKEVPNYLDIIPMLMAGISIETMQ